MIFSAFKHGQFTTPQILAISVSIIVVAAILERLLGHIWICECGAIKLWYFITGTSENSQHITDWYSYSHIIHGFVFYWLLTLIPATRKLPMGTRFLIALGVEAAWEVFENTDLVINRYRTATISLDYYGDSIINSISDILYTVLSFWAAWKFPVWSIVAAMIAFELVALHAIRDNLLLNIIMLIYPVPFILEWQSG